MINQDKIGFGGGCHWCTEAVFQSLRGVDCVEQGFIRSAPPEDDWSEAVIVTYSANDIGLDTLINVHIRTHSATKRHSMRPKYRSAIYSFTEAQAVEAQSSLTTIAKDFSEPIITQVLPFTAFKASDGRFQNYYKTNPKRPFCQRYIDPKLALIRQEFAAQSAQAQIGEAQIGEAKIGEGQITEGQAEKPQTVKSWALETDLNPPAISKALGTAL